MRMTRRPFSVLRLSLAAAATALALAGCRDAGPGSAKLPTDAGEGLYPSIAVSTSRGTATAQLSLRQVPGGLTFASYQGELTYDPQALEFQGADLPAGVDGAANLAAPGRVRFVGAAVDGTAGAPLLTLRFAAKGQVSAGSFHVAFEEVTGDDYTDLTAQVKGDLIFTSR